ncbi:MAG: glutathione S-transferase family protein [Gammaproteobacteria bacterium]|jgi:glutathione S-transferase|nr:glutathione S-transferase family protein [Gammaproteobacteria bacterium]MBT4494829.1 glutathione S-transferase family protein [Gammaproteobacteria bacterium]MBT7370137.1 glutathione S-transferase family protein [Gammaproteobacteria bacterium]
MSELILHQYAESLFSEKVRLLLGYKRASYRMVEIPMIMPRPYYIPLTGGYRKTPVLQIGSDIYCDTALICRVIDDMYPENTIYPEAQAGTDNAVAQWTDSFFLKVCAGLVFQPKAAAANPLFQDEEKRKAFVADRINLTGGSNDLQMALETAEPYFLAHLDRLDTQLGGSQPFLGGETPSIADFSTYHNCWFVNERDVLRDMFDPFRHVIAWYDRMVDFGHGEFEMISGAAALDAAIRSEPDEVPESVFVEDFEVGQEVDVLPIDYGRQPVRGELLIAGLDEIAVVRNDDQAGRMVVHFPRMGFEIQPVN